MRAHVWSLQCCAVRMLMQEEAVRISGLLSHVPMELDVRSHVRAVVRR